MAIEDIRSMADEVALLMASRLGGLRPGQRADLATMLRRRGAALPPRLRREARMLAWADRCVGQPKLARRLDSTKLAQAHHALVGHLAPLGRGRRFRRGMANVAATVAFGLLLAGAAAIWILIRRGSL